MYFDSSSTMDLVLYFLINLVSAFYSFFYFYSGFIASGFIASLDDAVTAFFYFAALPLDLDFGLGFGLIALVFGTVLDCFLPFFSLEFSFLVLFDDFDFDFDLPFFS